MPTGAVLPAGKPMLQMSRDECATFFRMVAQQGPPSPQNPNRRSMPRAVDARDMRPRKSRQGA